LVRAAILAANAHNAQAWRFAVTQQRIDVYDDGSRSLGAVDPYRREIHLSAGCAVENLVLAAAASGLAATVTHQPTADRTLLARVDLASARSDRSPLYLAIPHRHTDRGAYQTGRALPADVISGMDALVDVATVRVQWLTTIAQRSAFSTATTAATESFIADARQSLDDYGWYRGTWDQVQAHRDGVTVDASGLTPLLRGLGKMVPATRTSNDQYWLSGTRDRQLPTAAAFGLLLVTDSTDIGQRLAAGRVYQRLHLWATTQGLAMQPLNQLVERGERERSTTGPGPDAAALTSLVGDPSWQVVMPFRVGYPTSPAPASPRRAIDDVLIGAR
jgi:nitroreductase